MARGAEEKLQIQNQILEKFNGAFVYGKEIRIPVGDVQIKVVLTCAKDNVAAGEDNAIPGAAVVAQESTDVSMESQIEPSALKVSEEEKNKAKALLAAMQF